jgi:hypothetical protein
MQALVYSVNNVIADEGALWELIGILLILGVVYLFRAFNVIQTNNEIEERSSRP